MGRTPLIKLSPKKTWEGFIGGAAATLIASWYLAAFMSRYQWMTCERNVRAQTLKSPAESKCYQAGVAWDLVARSRVCCW